MFKKGWLMVGIVFLLLLLSACNSENTSNDDEKTTIRIGNFYSQETTYGKAFDKLKEDIEAASDGSIEIQVFHNGSLGSEMDHIQAVHQGSLEMMHSGTGGIGNYIPETAIFELWYNFNSLEQLKEVFEGLTPELDEMYQAEGFKLLGAYYDGPRNILSNVKIESIEDMQNLNFRVPDSTLYVAMSDALKANTITMPYGDVYTSLQTGAIDAMEGTPDSILQENFFEQGKYFILDQHVYQPLSIVYNLDAWNSLTSEQQEIIENAVKDASEYHLELAKEANTAALEELKSKGIELIELNDIDKWREQVTEENQEYVDQYGEKGAVIYDAIQKVLGSN
ncbi:TRAP transporter substrate-binding protein [Bacillus litorisediminis]|uniref:TRAP transporter substrate-binding protein n=1 Tax=Bacillus litorisediminis TaxID=2922713 RepID=UPI001FAE3568|nr:TRAP transporter substrate-binding protein [Bacillus litorisediminis]